MGDETFFGVLRMPYDLAMSSELARRQFYERTQQAAAEIESLRAQVARLTDDAERYRLLRRGQHWSVIDYIGDTLRGEGLDAAIDAAILSTKEQP